MTSALKRESSRGPTKFEEAGSTIFRAAFKMYPRLEISYSYKGTFRLLLKTFITRIDLYALDLQLFLSKLSSYSWKLLFHLNSEATLRYFFFFNTFLGCQKDIIISTETTKPPASIQLGWKKVIFFRASKESK